MSRAALRPSTLLTSSLVILLLGSVFCPEARAQTPTFGPERFVRSTGKPLRIVRTFPASNTAETFYLSVLNGEGEEGRVTSAVIELNGQVIAGPEEFEMSAREITKSVTLEHQNTLVVELRGAPGTFIDVALFQPPKFFLFTHPADPLFLRAETAEGETVEYFGTKDEEGLATSLTSVVWRRANGESTKYNFDAQSRPVRIEAFNGLVFDLAWQTDTRVDVTVTSADGSMQVTAPVDFTPQAALRRALDPRTNRASCCSSAPRSVDARAGVASFSRVNYFASLSEGLTAESRRLGGPTFAQDFYQQAGPRILKSSLLLRPRAQTIAQKACAAAAKVLRAMCETFRAMTLGGAVPIEVFICPALAVAATLSPLTAPLVPLLFNSCPVVFAALRYFCKVNALSTTFGGPDLPAWLWGLIAGVSDQPSGPPPAPVSAFINIPCTTANYLNVFWSRNAESGIAGYKVYRDGAAGVTTSDHLVASMTNNNPSSFFYRDGGLAAGTYFYKVFTFNQSGSAGSNEVSGRVFAPDELVTVIPGVPEPGDATFPSQFAIPSFVFNVVQFDCSQRNSLDPNTCDGSYVPIGTRIDCSGHVMKMRTFPTATIEGSVLNGITNLKYVVHLGDTVRMSFFAQDDHYTFKQPDNGFFLDIPQGVQRNLEFSPFVTGTFPMLIRDSGGAETTVGTITVVP